MNTRKAQTRQRIIAAAGKGIREHGYGGIGVDGIAKEAGVTSGAIYGHFGSKDKVFEASVSAGMNDFVEGVKNWRLSHGENWLDPFIEWYLSSEKRGDICGGCALPGLTADVARAGQGVHAAYEKQLRDLVEVLSDGLPSGDEAARKRAAWSLLSILGGGVMMSRAVEDEELAAQIAAATIQSAKKIVSDI